jgi:hypothetical protein
MKCHMIPAAEPSMSSGQALAQCNCCRSVPRTGLSSNRIPDYTHHAFLKLKLPSCWRHRNRPKNDRITTATSRLYMLSVDQNASQGA